MYGGEEERVVAGGGADRNFSITFNINHGVQILRPPPYSAAHRRGHNNNNNIQQGPPPPYMSNENLAAGEPLLMMAENNNNGDINGNSNMEDNNNVMANRNVAAVAPAPGAGTIPGDQHQRSGLGPTPPLDHSTPSPSSAVRPLPPSYEGLNRTRYSDTTNSSTETEEEDDQQQQGRLWKLGGMGGRRPIKRLSSVKNIYLWKYSSSLWLRATSF